MQSERVGFPGGAGQRGRRSEQPLAFGAVVAAEVGRFAHFRHGVLQRLAGFLREQRHEAGAVRFDQVRQPRQTRPAGIRRRRIPRAESVRCFAHKSRWIAGFLGQRLLALGPRFMQQLAHRRAIAHVKALGVAPHVAEQRARQRDARMRGRVGFGQRQRIPHHFRERHRIVQKAVHEGRVGAVLQQPPHQIAEQFLVRTHRRVDAHGREIANPPPRFVVEQFAHAVQPLELAGLVRLAAEFQHRGDGVRIVGGEVRLQMRRLEQASRARQIRHVRERLAGVDGIARQALHLCALDLEIPIGALHQAHVQRAFEGRQPVDDRRGALRVRLHGEAKAVPARQFRGACHMFEEAQRELEALGFFGVDGEQQFAFRCFLGEAEQRRAEGVLNPLRLQRLEARMQRRELHGDSRPGAGGIRSAPVLLRRIAHNPNRVAIGVQVAGRVLERASPFAEHVEGSRLGQSTAPRQRLFDGAPAHELRAENAHRPRHRRPGHRFADAPGKAADPAAYVRRHVLAQRDDAAGEHQRPCGGVEEQRVRVAEMPFPVGAGDPLRHQRLGGVFVWNAQQRLADAHERDALFVGKAELLQEQIERGALVRSRATPRHQIPGAGQHALPLLRGKRHFGQARPHGVALGQTPGSRNRRADARRGGSGLAIRRTGHGLRSASRAADWRRSCRRRARTPRRR